MPAPYSNDLRLKVIEAYKSQENSRAELSKRFNVSIDFIQDLIQRYEETGEVFPKPHNGGRVATIRNEKEKYLRYVLKAEPDLTLEELQEKLHRGWCIYVCLATLSNTLKRLGLKRKKAIF